jgi:hypothetical protein
MAMQDVGRKNRKEFVSHVGPWRYATPDDKAKKSELKP